MLEEVLKSININLERIANSLERNTTKITAKGIELPIPGQMSIEDVKPVGVEEPKTNTVQAPKVVEAATPVVPVVAQVESFTQEQLAVAMSNAVSAGKMDIITGILQKFNVQALTQIDPKDYNSLAVMLKEAGVKI